MQILFGPSSSLFESTDVLVKAYPSSFRREYGSEMVLVFREHVTDAWRQARPVGLMAHGFVCSVTWRGRSRRIRPRDPEEN